jgi:hypothetical protein
MTTETVKPLAYGIDSYLEWIKREGLLVHEGLALNLMKLETRDWPRFGIDGAALHFKGSNGGRAVSLLSRSTRSTGTSMPAERNARCWPQRLPLR